MALSIDEFLATVDEFQKLKTSFDLSSSTMPLGYVLAKSAAFKGSQLETTQETSLQVFFDANKLVAAAQASWDSKELSREQKLAPKPFEKNSLVRRRQLLLKRERSSSSGKG